MKTCTGCAEEKPDNAYYASSSGSTFSRCKTCCAEAQRKRNAADPEKRKAITRRCYEKHRKERLAAGQAYRAARPDAERARHVEYRASNRERVREQSRRYRAANKERVNKQALEYYYRNPQRSAITARRRKYGLTPDKMDELRAKQDFKCPVCARLLADVKEHVDHCHDTGVVRGILCAECNKAEGLLRKAAGGDVGLADALLRLRDYLKLDVA